MKYPPHQIRRYDLWAELDIAADTVVDIVVDMVMGVFVVSFGVLFEDGISLVGAVHDYSEPASG